MSRNTYRPANSASTSLSLSPLDTPGLTGILEDPAEEVDDYQIPRNSLNLSVRSRKITKPYTSHVQNRQILSPLDHDVGFYQDFLLKLTLVPGLYQQFVDSAIRKNVLIRKGCSPNEYHRKFISIRKKTLVRDNLLMTMKIPKQRVEEKEIQKSNTDSNSNELTHNVLKYMKQSSIETSKNKDNSSSVSNSRRNSTISHKSLRTSAKKRTIFVKVHFIDKHDDTAH